MVINQWNQATREKYFSIFNMFQQMNLQEYVSTKVCFNKIRSPSSTSLIINQNESTKKNIVHSIDWFCWENLQGNPVEIMGNRWFPVDFPISQPIDSWLKAPSSARPAPVGSPWGLQGPHAVKYWTYWWTRGKNMGCMASLLEKKGVTSLSQSQKLREKCEI